jgi:hypothetical protein
LFSYTTPLTRLVVGDIFHAQGSTGQSLICIVVDVAGNLIRGRTVTHQLVIDFDRRTGQGEWHDNTGTGFPSFQCRIDSIEPLPLEMHNVLLGLDRRMRLTLDRERLKLSEEEKAALVYVSDFYPRHLITRTSEA